MSPQDIAWKPFAVSQVRPAIAIALARPGVDEAGVAATDDRLDRLGIVVVVKIPKHDELDFRVGLQVFLQLGQGLDRADFLQREHIRLGREDALDHLGLGQLGLERPILDGREDVILDVLRGRADRRLRLAKRAKHDPEQE